MTRILLTLLCLMVIPCMAFAAGFNTTGDGLLVSYSGSALPSQGGATIAEIVDILQSGVFDPTTGLPAAGGRAYFYAPGTTTLKDVYADGNLMTVANNPVVLNSAGVATVYGYGTYKIIITNSRGQRIYTYPAVRYIGGPDIVSVFDVHDENDTSYLTRIITDQMNSGMSAVYATESTNGVILPMKFGSSLTSSTGLYVTNSGERWGVNNSSPSEALDVTGNIKSSGTITTSGSLNAGAGVFTGQVDADKFSTNPIVGFSVGSKNILAAQIAAYSSSPSVSIYDTDASGSGGISYGHFDTGTMTTTPKLALVFIHNNSAATNSVIITDSTAATTPFRINGAGGVTLSSSSPGADKAFWNSSQLYVDGKTTIAGDLRGIGAVTLDSTLSVAGAFTTTGSSVSIQRDGANPTLTLRETQIGDFCNPRITLYAQVTGGRQGDISVDSDGDVEIAASTGGRFLNLVASGVGINDSSPSADLDVNGDTVTSTLAIRTPGTGTGTILGIDLASTSKEVILLTSSRRFKRDIEPYEIDWDRFMEIESVTYRPIDNAKSKKLNGLIAEDLNKSFPGTVQLDADGKPFSIDYGRLVSPVIAAVQELKRMVDERDLKIASLEARLDEMEKRIRKIEKLVEGR